MNLVCGEVTESEAGKSDGGQVGVGLVRYGRSHFILCTVGSHLEGVRRAVTSSSDTIIQVREWAGEEKI